MGTLIMIVFAILGYFIAKITWKLYPNFLSRRDYYRNSPFDIVKMRGVTTLSAFLTTCTVGYIITQGLKKGTYKESKETIETTINKETKKTHSKKVDFHSTDTIPEKSYESKIQSEQLTESTVEETTTDSI